MIEIEPKIFPGEFPFFWPPNSPKFSTAKSQMLSRSPTLRKLLIASPKSGPNIDRFIQAGLMFSDGGDGLEGTKIATALMLVDIDQQVAQHVASEFGLREDLSQYLKETTLLRSKTIDERELNSIKAEGMLAFVIEKVASIASVNPYQQPERAQQEAQEAFQLARLLKTRIKSVFEDPSNEISVIGSINDAASALRDIGLYLRHPDFFIAVAKIVTDLSGVLLENLYNSEFHGRLAREILTRNLKKKEVKTALTKAHIVGGIKSISSQLYTDGPPLSTDYLEERAKLWQNNRRIVESQIRDELMKLNDKIRMQLYLPDSQTFNTLANVLIGSVPMQKLILWLRRFPKEMRDNLKAHIWISHYPPGGVVSSEMVTPGNDPAAQVISYLNQDLEKGKICYASLHAYVIAQIPTINPTGKISQSGVPIEIQLRLEQGPLRALYRAGSLIRRSAGEGGAVPPYQEIFGDRHRLITEKAKAELREIE